jgi:hypothetical protein
MPALGRTSRSKLVRFAVGRAATLAALLVGCLPAAIFAQTGSVVEGRVLDLSSGTAVRNAIVDLPGHASTLTDQGGAFRFEDVPPGPYTLRVDAFGFAVESLALTVAADTALVISVRYQPLALDPVVVESRLIDISGRVWDPARDMAIVDAEVFTNQVEGDITGPHGRFDVDDVRANVPLRVVVQALGYVTLDTVFIPDEDRRYHLELRSDPRVEALIEAQAVRIHDRDSPTGTAMLQPMDRKRALEYAGNHTVATMLEWEYGRRIGRVACTLVNEVQWIFEWQPSTLSHILPEDIQRIQFLFEGKMMRIYTREFMREMITREVDLRTPVYIERLGTDPVCY